MIGIQPGFGSWRDPGYYVLLTSNYSLYPGHSLFGPFSFLSLLFQHRQPAEIKDRTEPNHDLARRDLSLIFRLAKHTINRRER